MDESDEDSQSQLIFSTVLILAHFGMILVVVAESALSLKQGLAAGREKNTTDDSSSNNNNESSNATTVPVLLPPRSTNHIVRSVRMTRTAAATIAPPALAVRTNGHPRKKQETRRRGK